MRIKKSGWKEGWIGFFTEGEDGRPEETLSVRDEKKAQQIIDQLQKDLIRVNKSKGINNGKKKN